MMRPVRPAAAGTRGASTTVWFFRVWPAGPLLALFGLLTFVARTASSDEVLHAVVLRRPPRADTFIDEAVIRTIGELNALGFDVRVVQRTLNERNVATLDETPASPPLPLIAFSREGKTLVVEAYCPDCTSPVRQTLELDSAENAPDVAAIRAVETLRAALMEYAERTESVLPESFLHYQSKPPAETPAPPARKAAPEAANPIPKAPSTPVNGRPSSWCFGGFIGPTFAVDLEPAATAVGWLASIHAQRGAWGIQLQADAPFRERVFERTAGRAEITSLRFGAALRFRAEVAPKLFTGLSAGGGMAHYTLDATANPGFVAEDASHDSPYWSVEWANSYAFTKNIATNLRVATATLTNRPVLRIADEHVGTLGTPTLLFALGLEITAEPW